MNGIVVQDIPDSTDPYINKYRAMAIHPDALDHITGVAKKVVAGKEQYDTIEAITKVPWWFSGIIHYRESDLDFNTYLGNGQSLHRRTTITPKGRGPFVDFKSGALDALKLMGFLNLQWSLGKALYRWEAYNGLGYRKHGISSPYVWAGSNIYVRGKFVADHDYDPNAVDNQLGCATILKVLTTLVPIEFSF